MPKFFVYLGLTVIVLAMLPPALIARARTRNTDARRIHYIQDMDNQPKYRAQHANPIFADGRAMRPPVEGTISRTADVDAGHRGRGVVGGAWATTLPPELPMTMERLERGQERYEIYCTMCHGVAGYGDGIINKRANELMNNPAIGNGTAWVQPKNIHEPEIREQPVGQIFNSITNGIRNMSGYGAQIPVDDRWAIAAYVKALQRSQSARMEDVPPSRRGSLPVIDLMPAEEE
ncbi:MAG: cytochrome c [Phycisphaerales bacterium]|nr:cytochrome c [Phycisphaerae bacterium]NNF41647.1 cytochrome c [Phycisphaerales bacterium]NNM27006.1 cytochrome c [Phycisphaerales bacterium]